MWSGFHLYFIVVFICISLVTNDVEHLSLCLFAICVFFGEMSIQIFCSFFKIWTFFIVELQVFSSYRETWFTNIFSRSLNCIFTFLIVTFEALLFLILMKTNFLFLLLSPCACNVTPKKSLPNLRSQRCVLCFLLRVLEWSILSCVWCEIGSKYIVFACGYLIVTYV